MTDMTRGALSQFSGGSGVPNSSLSHFSQRGSGIGMCNASAKIRLFTPNQTRNASAITEHATSTAGRTALKTAMTAFHISLSKNPMRGERKLLNSRRWRTSSGSRFFFSGLVFLPASESDRALGNSFPQRARHDVHHAPMYPPPETVER